MSWQSNVCLLNWLEPLFKGAVVANDAIYPNKGTAKK